MLLVPVISPAPGRFCCGGVRVNVHMHCRHCVWLYAGAGYGRAHQGRQDQALGCEQ